MSHSNNCPLCNRSFTHKTDLTKHQIYCLYLQSKKNSPVESDAWESPLSDSQRDSMLRHLLVQMNKMNEKMNSMQTKIQSLSQSQKINILHFLNSSEIKPAATIQQWVKSVTVTQRHLEIVFQKSIKDSIIQVLLDALDDSKKQNTYIPIKCFIQKPKQLYVYSGSSSSSSKKWEILELSLLKTLCSSIGSRVSELFIQWQQEHNEKLTSCLESQEKQFLFMKKFMDETYKKNIYLGEMIELIHDQTKTNFQQIQFE